MIDYFCRLTSTSRGRGRAAGMGTVGWARARRCSMHWCGLYRMCHGDEV